MSDTVIDGEYTSATIKLDRSQIEDSTYEQVKRMVNHPAFQNEIIVMPDAHVGSGSVIGFTMPMGSRVSPNVVGVDIGCGVTGVKAEESELSIDMSEIDDCIRETVPTGHHTHTNTDYHVMNDFPWDELNKKWNTFVTNHLSNIDDFGDYHPDTFSYDISYFKSLCNKISENNSFINKAINSIGSLGKGNHFIELSRSERTGSLWCVVHSGSRKLGYNVAKYHQNIASDLRSMNSVRKAMNALKPLYREYIVPDVNAISNDELHTWIHQKKIVDYEQLRRDYSETDDAPLIEKISNVINDISKQKFRDVPADVYSTDINDYLFEEADNLAYLEGEEAVEYYVDMAFAQTYASESRLKMVRDVMRELGLSITDTTESIHNYINYADGIMRKGATPARENEQGIIPMNMSYGSLRVNGNGAADWNNSAPHGAGRRMSRRQAKEKLEQSKLDELMGDVYASARPLDESPEAYKDVAMVREAMAESVDITDVLKPIVNVKHED